MEAMVSRRTFARALLAGGSAALLPASPLSALATSAPAPIPAPPSPDERYWSAIREQFLMPVELAPLNAANLCPSPSRVLESLYRHTVAVDRDPSPQNRAPIAGGREQTRRVLAEFLRASPEEIVITRNTSEANNLVSSGLALDANDEVLVFADNHPSNHAAWRAKGTRAEFTVRVLDVPQPHPGPEYYLEAVTRALGPRTRVLAFTHVTNTVGDLFPATELCRLARDRDVLTLVDGAQSFGVVDVDLSAMEPDFFTGSAHKWPCGPRETGVLFVNRRVHDRIVPSVVSLYPGAVGIARQLEGMGQRDDASIVAFGEALEFQRRIGLDAIESRARELAQALKGGLRPLDGVRLWTHPDPDRSAAVVSLHPGSLDPRRLATALYEEHRIVCAVRGGDDRPGIRFSPHLYNLHAEIDRVVAALARYLTTGV